MLRGDVPIPIRENCSQKQNRGKKNILVYSSLFGQLQHAPPAGPVRYFELMKWKTGKHFLNRKCLQSCKYSLVRNGLPDPGDCLILFSCLSSILNIKCKHLIMNFFEGGPSCQFFCFNFSWHVALLNLTAWPEFFFLQIYIVISYLCAMSPLSSR